MEISALELLEQEIYISAPITSIFINDIIRQWFETCEILVNDYLEFDQKQLGHFYTKLLSLEVKIRDFKLYQNLVAFIKTCIRNNYLVKVIDYNMDGGKTNGCNGKFEE